MAMRNELQSSSVDRIAGFLLESSGGEEMAYNKNAYDEKSRKRAAKYLKNNTFSASVRLNYNTEPELIEIYKQIPNKSQFLKQAIKAYAERMESGEDLTEEGGE